MPDQTTPGHADLARLRQAEGWDRGLARPAVMPGSATEEEIIDQIDAAREADVARISNTPKDRRRASYRYWRQRGRHLL